MYIYVCVYMYIYKYIYMYIYIYICLCVCVCVCIYLRGYLCGMRNQSVTVAAWLFDGVSDKLTLGRPEGSYWEYGDIICLRFCLLSYVIEQTQTKKHWKSSKYKKQKYLLSCFTLVYITHWWLLFVTYVLL